jgi:hypothetical protein
MADGESKPTSLLGTLTAVAATIGAFIAVGQAASEAVRGYYTAQMENKRAEQQLQIETLKTQSDLAKDYLGIIFKSETSRPDRIALFGALKTLSGHPLQPWAEAQFLEETGKLNEVEKARESQLEHAREGVVDALSTTEDVIRVLAAEYRAAPPRQDQKGAAWPPSEVGPPARGVEGPEDCRRNHCGRRSADSRRNSAICRRARSEIDRRGRTKGIPCYPAGQHSR